MMAWRRREDGLELFVRLTPRAARDAVDGVVTRVDGAALLTLRVTAPPDDGRANTALRILLARGLDVAPSEVTLAAGHKARQKRVFVAGDPEKLASRLQNWLKTAGS